MDVNKINYQDMVKEVDTVIADILNEFVETNELLNNNKNLVRIRILISFSLLEVLCVIFNQYYDLKLADRALLKKFIKDFCLTDKNEFYKNHPYLNRIDEGYLYELRCSITHAFALPEQKNNLAVTFPNGPENTSFIKEIEKGFKEKGLNPVFISPDSLLRLFLKGGMMLVTEMFPNIINEPTKEQLEAIQRVYKEVLRRESKPIPLW